MFHVTTFDSLPSTNDYAKAHGRTLPNHTVIVANNQTAGRGRFTRSWISGDDLTFTIVFQERCFSHAILAPLAVVFALSNVKVETQIKWPNDILYQGKKCAGILVERIYEEQEYFDVVGIGINFSSKGKEALSDKAIALPEICQKEDVFYRILNMYQMLLRMDHASIMRQYRSYSAIIHKMINWHGDTVLVKDIGEDGTLIIEKEDKKICVNSGEITLDMWYQEGE